MSYEVSKSKGKRPSPPATRRGGGGKPPSGGVPSGNVKGTSKKNK